MESSVDSPIIVGVAIAGAVIVSTGGPAFLAAQAEEFRRPSGLAQKMTKKPLFIEKGANLPVSESYRVAGS